MPAVYNIATYNFFSRHYKPGSVGVIQTGQNNHPNVYALCSTSTTRYYTADSEREIVGERITTLTYINSPHGHVATVKTSGTQHDAMLIATDHLGSIIGVWNAQGTLLEEHRYTAWGQRTSSTANPRLRRGFTGHEHLQHFGLIDMQARLYDPHLGRFLAPDPYVQAPDNHLSLNRYAYCFNNPLKYTDPTGEFCITPIIIGAAAIIGAYTGGVIANEGQYNPVKWDYSAGKTWGYMLGGAAVGAASAWAGGIVAASGMPFANTASIVTGSFLNSIGTHIYTNGETDVSICFGFGSYNLTKGEFKYLGKKGNTKLENILYAIGALGNLSDILAGLHPGEVQLHTEYDSDYSKLGDYVGHSQIADKGKPLIDWGPAEYKDAILGLREGTNAYERGIAIANTSGRNFFDPVNISGVNINRINWFSSILSKGGKYNLIYNNCVSMTSRSLNISGVFNIGIHPYVLHTQMLLRSWGIRPLLYPHFLLNTSWLKE